MGANDAHGIPYEHRTIFLLQRWSDTKTLPVKSPSSEMFIILLHTALNILLQLTPLEGGRLD